VTEPDLTEFDAENARPRRPCLVGLAIENLDEDHRRSLMAALGAPHIKHTAIARVLERWGVQVRSKAIGEHRTGGCCCGR
jgi:hypothetical protein